MKTDMIKITEISEYKKFMDCKPEWENLLSRSRADNVFLTHDWIAGCIKYFYAGDRLLILNIFDGADLTGIAPLVIKKGGYFGLPIRTVSFIGTSISDRMDFILAGDKKEIIPCNQPASSQCGVFNSHYFSEHKEVS